MRYRLYAYRGWPGKLTNGNQPDIRPIGKNRYILKNDYSVSIEMDISPLVIDITVEKGFVHDGASVPRIAWSMSGLTPDGLIRAAALIHDYLYQNKGIPGYKTKRKDADRLFLYLMRAAGMSKYRSYIAYKAVRLFGRGAWK